MGKSKKCRKRATTLQRRPTEKKKIPVLLIFKLIPHIKFQDHIIKSLTVHDRMQA